MKYKPGDEVEARNYQIKGGPWQPAVFTQYWESSHLYQVSFKNGPQIAFVVRIYIRPRTEAANAT